ncbi:MAG TPA: transporter substrate-binding domain-containing protein [Candidatus Aphodousia faecipullorum]|nr:transporter substrate-binding domain-containing protein [Candidatus Aphodousia faecipullorum]
MSSFTMKCALIALTMACGATLCACTPSEEESNQQTAENQDLLDTIRTRGKIIIATEGTWAPWTFHDETGKLTGYDIELGRAIAKKMGVQVEFIEGKWDGLLAGVSSGRYDIMINGVDITPDREKAYHFTDPYAYNRTVVIVTEGNTTIQSMADLKGKQTANTISSTYATIAEKYGAKVLGVDDLNQTFELLLGGRIDATLNAEVTYYDYKKVHTDAPIKIAAIADETTSVGIPLRKENTEKLRTELNKILSDMRTSGELSALAVQFFGTDISKQ